MICINKKILLLLFIFFIIVVIVAERLLSSQTISYKSSARIRAYQYAGKTSPTPAVSACSIDQRCNKGSYYFRCGDRKSYKVAITIDDCFFPEKVDSGFPRQIATADIVKKAKELKIPLTFFCIGRSLETNRDFFSKLIQDNSFELQNHTYSHKDLNTLSSTDIKYQIESWLNAYNKLNPPTTKAIYLRPPGMSGVDNPKIIKEAKSLSISGFAGGSLASRSVLDGRITANQVVSCVSKNLQNGDIIILHHVKQDSEALDGIVKAIKEKGLELVTLSQLPGIYKK